MIPHPHSNPLSHVRGVLIRSLTSLEVDRLHWWYWMGTLLLLGAGFLGARGAFEAVVAIAAFQVVHYRWMRGSFSALAVQVRITALGLFAIGLFLPPVNALLAVGLLARCTVGYCFAARVLMLLPWNRERRLTRAFVLSVLLAPPSTGRLEVA